jgi:hypothetical protein
MYGTGSRVADPHNLNGDSDPAFHFNADPDPAPHHSDGTPPLCSVLGSSRL